MDRPTLLPIGIAVLIFVSAALLWSMTSPAERAPRTHTVQGISGPVRIDWHASGIAVATLRDEQDTPFVLGYIHGMRRTWTLLLWRQAAEGHLSTWFGESVTPIDEHVHQLGIPYHAERALERLPDSTRRRLQAYTSGVNAALSTEAAANRKPLLALGVEPERWKPSHSLAVERLFAWLTSAPIPAPARSTSALTAFRGRDALLRRFLHVHGLERSVAWARRDTAAVITSRYVTGATARPLLQDVVIDTESGTRITGGTLPGTPLALAGTRRVGPRPGTTWSFLPGQHPRLRRVAADSLRVDTRYARLTPLASDEHLVSIPTAHLADGETGLPLAPLHADPPPTRKDSLPDRSPSADRAPSDSTHANALPVDSTWVLTWRGQSSTSDLDAWARLPSGDASGFSLHEASGFFINESGAVSVFGTPRHQSVHATPNDTLTVIGRSAWVHPVAQALASHHERRAVSESLSDTSAWAGLALKRMLPHLASLSSSSSRMQEARTYLRNWDANYERASIGASVFEVWMEEYARDIGYVPFLMSPPGTSTHAPSTSPISPRVETTQVDSLPPDSTFFAAHRQRQAFRRAVQRLTAAHGTDLRQWRWERVAPDRRYFPVWSADSLVHRDLSSLASTRYAPIDVPGIGHPSTPSGGPSLLAPTAPARSPTTWSAWTTPARDHLVVRRHEFDVDAFFSRPFLRRDVAPAIALVPLSEPRPTPSPAEPSSDEIRRTRLVPQP